MELNHLKAFVQVGKYGSFSRAADALGLTQSGVSRQVGQIEKELGIPLFSREQRPVALTRAGRELLSCAIRVLDDMDETISKIKSASKQIAGTIRITASTIPGEFTVPNLLTRFTAIYPAVRPSLLITDSAGVVAELLERRAEVGFLGAALEHPRLRLAPIGQDEIILVAPAGHLLAARTEVHLTDLAGQAFVEREGGSGTLESLNRLLAEQGLALPEYQVVMIAGTSQTQLAAIEAGAGLGFVSSLALASRERANVIRIALRGLTFKRTLYLAHEPASLSALAREFLRFAMQSTDS